MGSSSGAPGAAGDQVTGAAKVRPRPLVFCGPSGSGKSTLVTRLMAEFSQFFEFSVSHTTRQPRAGEVAGQAYHFVTRPEMVGLVEQGRFLEHATFSGNMYGTSRAAVEKVADLGRICILDIDVQGVKQIKERETDLGLSPKYVFVKPPSREVLEERLRGRGTENEDSLARRLAAAYEELKYGELEGNFDVVIVNDDLEKAYGDLRKYVLPEIERLK